jgi:hypothetical protein
MENINVISVINKHFPKDKYKTIDALSEVSNDWSAKDLTELMLELGQKKSTKDISIYIIKDFIKYASNLKSFEELNNNWLIDFTQILAHTNSPVNKTKKMESKHTKGEWTIKQNGRSYRLITETEHHEGIICPNIYGANEIEAEANAKLLQAAPKLLEALQLIDSLYGDRNDFIEPYKQAWIKAKEAIKKATE